MRPVLVAMGLVVAGGTVAGQGDSVRTDPAADRAILVATAEQLPATRITASGHFFALLPALTFGASGWATFTIGTSPLALLVSPRGHLIYGSVKFRVADTPHLGLAVGDFFGTIGFDEGTAAAHYPFMAMTASMGAVDVTGTAGYGFGSGFNSGGREEHLVWQAAVRLRLDEGARFAAEYHRLSPGEGMLLAAVRMWGVRPWFIELGVFRQYADYDPQPALGPWFSIGYRIR